MGRTRRKLCVWESLGKSLNFPPEPRDVARVNVFGVERVINVGLLANEGLNPGDWVLIHVGFALAKMDEAEAKASMAFLQGMGEAFTNEIAAAGTKNMTKTNPKAENES